MFSFAGKQRYLSLADKDIYKVLNINGVFLYGKLYYYCLFNNKSVGEVLIVVNILCRNTLSVTKIELLSCHVNDKKQMAHSLDSTFKAIKHI